MLPDYPTQVWLYLCGIAALFGLVMGSALNCLALRLASGKKWSGASRSACPHCGHTLQPVDLVPLFSWLLLKGKCRYCKAPVSPRYPITEAALALIYVALVLKFGLSLQLLSALVFASCLFCLSLVDLDTQIIPDRFILIPIVVRLIELVITGGFRALLSPILTGLVIAGAVLIISLIMDKLLKKDTMGGGDIKLLFVIGLFLSVPECLLMVMLACVIGILMASLMMKVRPDTPFPFGPALSIAALISMLVGSAITSWYISLF